MSDGEFSFKENLLPATFPLANEFLFGGNFGDLMVLADFHYYRFSPVDNGRWWGDWRCWETQVRLTGW